MTDDEALRISRKAAQDARKRVGFEKDALDQEFESMAETDPMLAEALLITGLAIIESQQDTKH
ncbi:hypothetical protein PQR71_42505 [Paraburkholderia fungorum]|uniref:hypothetical protein n=1 Tax=Paraburkholderia fungorum TaxID=134537 RepID=UPI0038B8E56E